MITKLWNQVGDWFLSQYWKAWQHAHGIDPENPPTVDLTFSEEIENAEVEVFGHGITYGSK